MPSYGCKWSSNYNVVVQALRSSFTKSLLNTAGLNHYAMGQNTPISKLLKFLLLFSTFNIGSFIYLLSTDRRFMMDIIPDDNILVTSCVRSADSEQQFRIKGTSKEPKDFPTFLICRQKCSSSGSFVGLTWIRMIFLFKQNTRISLDSTMSKKYK